MRAAVQSLAQRLAERQHRVIAFLPRSRHDSFAAARDLPGFAPVELPRSAEAYLRLADADLGVPSALRPALEKGAAVHTSAMLEERRASEIAFDGGAVKVLFATGTLAQGLNLPATVVLIGGTDIGFDPDATPAQINARVRLQLLNAIGRAGRATVAARSMAIVVPTAPLLMRPETVVTDVLPRADFLAEEDASTDVESQLDGLIEQALGGALELGAMSPAEQTAFAFLSLRMVKRAQKVCSAELGRPSVRARRRPPLTSPTRSTASVATSLLKRELQVTSLLRRTAPASRCPRRQRWTVR